MKKFKHKDCTPVVVPAINGIGFAGTKVASLALVSETGDIKIITKKYKNNKISNIPFLRAFAFLFYGLIRFFSLIRESLHISEKVAKQKYLDDKIADKLNVSAKYVFATIISVVGISLGFLAFILLPKQIIIRIITSNVFFKQLILSVLKVIFLYVFFIIVRFIPAMSTFFRLNGAGNLALTKEKHLHYSMNFIFYIINSFLICFFVLPLINLNIIYIFQLFLNIFSILLIFALNYEFLKLLSRQKFALTKIYVKMFSWLVVSRPSSVEREIAEAGYLEFILMKNDDQRLIIENNEKKISLSAIIVETKNALKHIDDGDNEALWLIATCLNKNKLDLKLVQSITKDEQIAIRKATERRVNHEPLAKIFNKAQFYGRDFYVDKSVLAPRVETEQVVETAIGLIKSKGLSYALDLCTGSGIIAVTLAKETNVKVMATDYSKMALSVAERNAKTNSAKISFLQSDMFEGLKKKNRFDIIVSNPPYLRTEEIALASKEVKDYDPKMALDGGDDGLDFYRIIANKASNYLQTNGYIVLEIGYKQASEVKELLKINFENIRVKKDYFGNDRIVVAKKKENIDARKNTKTKKPI